MVFDVRCWEKRRREEDWNRDQQDIEKFGAETFSGTAQDHYNRSPIWKEGIC